MSTNVGLNMPQELGTKSRWSEVTMITNRSNHMPTLIMMVITNIAGMLRRTFLDHSDSGMITLHVNMIQNAHQKCPVARHQKMSRSYLLGPYAWAYWIMISCNVISPQIFWSKKARTSIPILFVLSIVINIGMWFERFVIIVTSLHRDFLPSAWGYFTPTRWDVACLLGSFGLFFTMFCLFVRFLPMVATAEVKTVLPQANPHGHSGHGRETSDRRATRSHGAHEPASEGTA